MLLDFDGIDTNIENKDGNTPLHYFCQKFKSPDDCQDIFDRLIAKGADINHRNRNGEGPLHKAIFNNAIRLLIVEMLLQAGGDVNMLNHAGETPLHYAVRLGRKDVVQTLVGGGGDITIKSEKENKTAYELAVEEKIDGMSSHLKKIQDLLTFLTKIDMQQYLSLFLREEIFLEECEGLEAGTLERMGISTAGHRIKILKACQQLGAQRPATPPTKPSSEKSKAELLQKSLLELDHVSHGSSLWINSADLEYTKKLGSGTSGKVYMGLYKGKEVAVKVLKKLDDEATITEFKKEFQIMGAIKSPYTVLFYGACMEPKLCMVMELCSRGSLYSVLQDRSWKATWEKFFHLAISVTAGVDVLHHFDPPIYHRDVKSLNYLVNKEWQVKVCDFGLSRFNTSNNLATLNKICGTVAFLAPEIYMGEQFTSKADVYSLGMTIWEILIRILTTYYSSPYSEYNFKFDWQILLATSQNNTRPTIPASCPSEIKELVEQCLDTDPNKRPSTTEIMKRLEHIRDEIYLKNEREWNMNLLLQQEKSQKEMEEKLKKEAEEVAKENEELAKSEAEAAEALKRNTEEKGPKEEAKETEQSKEDSDKADEETNN